MNYTDYVFIRCLKKLIAINNERYKRYSRALEKTNDQKLRLVFQQTKQQTLRFNLDLIRYVAQYDEAPISIGTGFSKTHRLWLSWLSYITGSRDSLLRSCQLFDALALRSYYKISRQLQHVPVELMKLLQQHKNALEHAQVQLLRSKYYNRA